MIIYGNPVEVEEYFADLSTNQSYLKQLIKGVDNLGEKEEDLYYKEKGHFVIGGAVDVYITQGVENFNAQYHISTGKKPSDAIMSMVQMIFDNNISDETSTQSPLEDFGQDILEALDFHKYQSRWKEETRINKVIEEGANYFSELQEAYGKKVLSHSEYQLISSILMSISTGKYTAQYFKDSKNVDIYYQVPIYFEYMGVPCKALLDIVRIDKENKTIEPIDLKTMSGFTVQFPNAVKSFGYNFQAAFYLEAVKSLVNKTAKCDKIKILLTGYKILPFKFIVETTHTVTNKLTEETRYFTGKPLVYQLSDEQIKTGKEGRPEIRVIGSNRRLKNEVDFEENDTVRLWDIPYKAILGFEDGLRLHHWHSENGFEEDKSTTEAGGIILVE